MPMRYTYDRKLGWIVLLGDVVIRDELQSEQECIQFIKDWPEIK